MDRLGRAMIDMAPLLFLLGQGEFEHEIHLDSQ